MLPDDARVRHLAYRLHRGLPTHAAIDAGGACREALAKDPALERLCPSAKLRLLRASAAYREDSARSALLRFSASSAFAALGAQAKLRLLERLCARGVPQAELLPHLELLAAAKAFASLPELTQAALIDQVAERPGDRNLALLFVQLLGAPGFAALPGAEQVELSRYLAGPRLADRAAPMRRNRMDLQWLARRREVATLLRERRFTAAEPAEQRERLRDFLSAPSRRIHFLSAHELNGHTLVVFGEPSDARALSYGRRYVLGPDKRPLARISSPDPTLLSGWKKPERDQSTTYESVAVRASRRDEWRLIEWLEQSYVLVDDTRALGVLGPLPVSGAPGRFLDAALAALLRMIAGLRPLELERGYVRGGRPLVNSTCAADREADLLLKAYLAG